MATRKTWNSNFNHEAGINTAEWNFNYWATNGTLGKKHPLTVEAKSQIAFINADNELVLKPMRMDTADGNFIWSVHMDTRWKVSTLYGRIECLAKIPSAKGMFPAFWMLPEMEHIYGGWPQCGEIDIMECLCKEPNRIYSTIHFGQNATSAKHRQIQASYTADVNLSQDYHKYAVEWRKNSLRFFIDEHEIAMFNSWGLHDSEDGTFPKPFDKPFHIRVNYGMGGGWAGAYDDDVQFGEDNEYRIKYIKITELEDLEND